MSRDRRRIRRPEDAPGPCNTAEAGLHPPLAGASAAVFPAGLRAAVFPAGLRAAGLRAAASRSAVAQRVSILRLVVLFSASVVLLGCKGEDPVFSETFPHREPAPRQDAQPVDSSVVPRVIDPALLALPTFVDGGVRCEVMRAPRSTWPGGPSGQASPSGLRVHSLGGDIPCTAPLPWCALFGPDKTDRDNHQLRIELSRIADTQRDRKRMLEGRLEDSTREQAQLRARHRKEVAELRRASQGEGVYLSNDESLSLASPQRLLWAIDHGAELPAEQVRPHELLNYFSFDTLPVEPGRDFSVLSHIELHPALENRITLGLSVRGRELSRDTRRRANLAYVIDRSGSMARDGRLEQVKNGVLRSLEQLREGDIVHMVLFDSTTCSLARNFVVGRDPMRRLKQLVASVEPRGASNLRDGLGQGYAAVNQAYQPDYTNRVLVMTDSEATTGTEEAVIGLVARNYDARRVRLSAIGVGSDGSDRLLDRITEEGKGASLFLASQREADLLFGERFPSLIETIAADVHFRLELPPSLALEAFYGEEASDDKSDVRALHFSSGTSQMYLANLAPEGAGPKPNETVRLTIEYDDPVSGEPRTERFSWQLEQLLAGSRNLIKARMVAMFGHQLYVQAERFGASERVGPGASWSVADPAHDRAAAERCALVQAHLDEFAKQLGKDREAKRMAQAWRRYCKRYPAPLGSDGG